jgi:hypothetical protein
VSAAPRISSSAAPEQWGRAVNAPSSQYAALLWAGLAPETRLGYDSAISGYETYCAWQGIQAWPPSVDTLGPYITTRAWGSAIPRLQQIKPGTIRFHLAAIRSYCVDRKWDTSALKDEHIARLLRGATNMFSSPARPRLPITRDILRKLVPASSAPEPPDDLNVSAALRVGWAAMIRLGEITYGKGGAIADKTVKRGDVSLRTDHAILRLRHSKTDVEKRGVDILLAATNDDLCPVEALRSLLGSDPQPDTSPLFRLQRGGFPKSYLVDRIRARLRTAGIDPTCYSGHSLRRGAAQEAANKGVSEQEIQLLGRWKSNAVRLYYTTPTAQRLALSRRLQSDAVRPLPPGIPVRGVTDGGAD